MVNKVAAGEYVAAEDVNLYAATEASNLIQTAHDAVQTNKRERNLEDGAKVLHNAMVQTEDQTVQVNTAVRKQVQSSQKKLQSIAENKGSTKHIAGETVTPSHLRGAEVKLMQAANKTLENNVTPRDNTHKQHPLLKLLSKVDIIVKLTLSSNYSQIGADIFKRALSYPAKQIAKNAGVNGNIVVEKVLSVDNMKYGYNAARDRYEDLIAAKILDPTKVVRCCLEHAAAVAKTFLKSDAVVIDILEPVSRIRRPPLMPTPGKQNYRSTQSTESTDYGMTTIIMPQTYQLVAQKE
ncbi:chaperonin 60 subunit beta 1, chloroplastic-like [Lycium barbarum]|uniref:chaperonin 60 subunit beta 1, chloroplastic-like n=1 Tax=Lycium barbarum TaxID=112863 RepID=UPI00293E916D|nr:chaperonin 60 subunit beta 1, chloroplastic-like [Lycium barbarum]